MTCSDPCWQSVGSCDDAEPATVPHGPTRRRSLPMVLAGLAAALVMPAAAEARGSRGGRGGSSARAYSRSARGLSGSYGGGSGGSGADGGCGSRGGPGYRKANGRCASWRD